MKPIKFPEHTIRTKKLEEYANTTPHNLYYLQILKHYYALTDYGLGKVLEASTRLGINPSELIEIIKNTNPRDIG